MTQFDDRLVLPVHASILKAMEAAAPGDPMSIVVRATALRPPQGSRRQPGDPPGYAQRPFLADLDADRQIEVRPCADLKLCQQVERMVRLGGIAVAYGRFLEDPPQRGQTGGALRFQLEGLRGDVKVTEMLGATEEEVQAARARIDDLKGRPGAIKDFLWQELIDIHGIRTEHLPPSFDRWVEATLLQAVSEGEATKGSNPRLSLYSLSEPGQGKGVLARIAQSLAPACQIVQPEMTTGPGLTARAEQRPGQGYVTTPGALARAHRGVCIWNDLHQVEGKDAKLYRAALSTVSEDGIFRLAKGSGHPYLSQSGVLINGNHRHVVKGLPCPKGLHNRLMDIGLEMDQVSRVDIMGVLGIGDDIDLIARDVAVHGVGVSADEEALLARERHLKVIVAVLRDEIPQVDTSQVEEELDKVVATAQGIVREYAALAEDEGALVPGSTSLRMARMTRKVTMASARLDGRSTAEPGDVACAGRMAGMKLEVIRWFCSQEGQVMLLGGLEQQERAALVVRNGRRDKMMELFGGQELSAARILEGVRGAGIRAGERTVAWDLRQMGVEVRGGKYRVPTREEWEKKLQEMEAQGKEKVEPAPAPQPQDLLPQAEPVFQPEDSLGKLPILMRPIARALGGGGFSEQQRQAMRLLRYVTERELDITEGPLGVAWFRCQYKEDVIVPVAATVEMERVLTEGTWEQRARLALQFYTQVEELPTVYGVLEEALQRDEVPEAVRRDIRSALARRVHLDDCYFKGVPANIVL